MSIPNFHIYDKIFNFINIYTSQYKKYSYVVLISSMTPRRAERDKFALVPLCIKFNSKSALLGDSMTDRLFRQSKIVNLKSLYPSLILQKTGQPRNGETLS